MCRTFISFRNLSLPVRGAWIEIIIIFYRIIFCRSLPVRGAWIEILPIACVASYSPSLPVRGAWIEIYRV